MGVRPLGRHHPSFCEAPASTRRLEASISAYIAPFSDPQRVSQLRVITRFLVASFAQIGATTRNHTRIRNRARGYQGEEGAWVGGGLRLPHFLGCSDPLRIDELCVHVQPLCSAMHGFVLA